MRLQKQTKKLWIQRCRNRQSRRKKDVVIVEEPLEIVLVSATDPSRQHSVTLTMRTPGEDFELAAGFLFCEGLIQSKSDIQRMDYCVKNKGKGEQKFNVLHITLERINLRPEMLLRYVATNSSCGVCGKTTIEALRSMIPATKPHSEIAIYEQQLFTVATAIREKQSLFHATGGVHCAAVFDLQGQIETLAEDVGRHNAVDKVLGKYVLEGTTDLSKHILAVSSRVSFEIVQKAARYSIPIICALGAATSLAIELAEEFGITLIGFVSDDSYNCYTGVVATNQSGV